MIDAGQTPGEPAADVVAGPVEFTLKRPRFWSVRFSAVFAMLVVSAGAFYASIWPPVARGGSALVRVLELVVPLAACLVALLARWRLRPAAVPPLSFHGDHFLAPRHPEGRTSIRVDYGEVVAVDLGGASGREQLFIGTRRRLLALPRLAFAAPDAIERALRELYVRILRLPEGTRIVEQIARRRRFALAAMSRSATATQLLLAVTVLLFALEWVSGALDEPFGPVRFGASAPVLIRDGEVYRLLASVLLHASVVHLYFDGLAFFFLGAILERVLGRSRFLLVYFVSGLAGAVASAVVSQRLFATHASAATFGLLGAYLVVSLRFGSDLPLGLRQPRRWWALMIGLNAAMPVALPEVDPLSMVAGLLAGVLTAFLVIDENGVLDHRAQGRLGLRFMAGMMASLYAAAFVAGLGHALRGPGDVGLRFARAATESSHTISRALQSLATRVAHDPAASAELLSVAASAAGRARQARPDDVRTLDAWATVQYRLGRLDDAIAVGREVIRVQPAPLFVEHLARYLDERAGGGAGPALVAAGDVGRVRLSAGSADEARPEPRLVVTLDRPLERPLALLALVRRGATVVGLARVRLSDVSAGSHELSAPLRDGWPAGVSFEVALLDAACDACAGEPALSYWPLEPSRPGLP
jgi:rhomboid protease GluP